MRICAADTRFAVKEVDIGIAADIGTLTRLPKVVGGGSWVKDVCLSGRGFRAAEAERVGLVSWVGKSRGEGGKGEVVGEAVRWAELVGGKSPVAVQGTKEILNWSWDRSVEDGEFAIFWLLSWMSVRADVSDRASLHGCLEWCDVAESGCQGGHDGGETEEDADVFEAVRVTFHRAGWKGSQARVWKESVRTTSFMVRGEGLWGGKQHFGQIA